MSAAKELRHLVAFAFWSGPLAVQFVHEAVVIWSHAPSSHCVAPGKRCVAALAGAACGISRQNYMQSFSSKCWFLPLYMKKCFATFALTDDKRQ